jgi:hypothetical protein
VRLDVVPARSFDGSSRVSTYWLANCEGFRVRSGRRRGVVVAVPLEAPTSGPVYLVVRYGLTRKVVEVGEVESVVPAEELLVVRPRERRSSGAVRARAAGLGPRARRAREVGGGAARAGGRLSVRAAKVGGRYSRLAAAATGRTSVRLGAATGRASVRFAAATARDTRRLAVWLEPRAARAARALGRAAAGAAILAALALAAAGRVVHRLGTGAAARLRPTAAEDGADDDRAPAPEPGRARQHAA